MPISIFNTLTGKKEEFVPLKKDQVSMYVCGITPYDETHLGHGRAYVTFDIVRRHLEDSGFKVNYIQNITDIDDKIIKKSNEGRVTSNEVAEKYTKNYLEVMDQLNVKRATKYPKATETIPDMIKVIKGLIDKGFAYEIDGDVYFEIFKFKDYGKLSKRKKKDMQAGARVEIDKRKKDPMDFALWKKAKEGEPSWDSPWGKGRPGWHIECSTMSNKFLGPTFDIHGGGRDLIFPHHENEIAQAEAYTGKPFARYWMHNGFVNVNQQKMSKSLGNFFTLKDIFKKFDPMVVRLFLLMTHYRSPINFSNEQLKNTEAAYLKIRNFMDNINFLNNKASIKPINIHYGKDLSKYELQFQSAMDDDFNTAKAIAVIFELIDSFYYDWSKSSAPNLTFGQQTRKLVLDLCNALGLKIKKTETTSKTKRLITEREFARKNKDFAKADNIRLELEEMGYAVQDTVDGTMISGGPVPDWGSKENA